MGVVEVRIDATKPLCEEPETGHNRWHPDIPPVAHCKPGDKLIMETRDVFDGRIGPETTIEIACTVDTNLVHPLTGPVHIEGAQPGDLLEVEMLDIVPDSFGYTMQASGFGFLRDIFPDPYLVKWQLKEGWATSKQLPGVRIPASPFMGTIGVAPSRRLMEKVTQRESAAIARGEFLFPPTEPAGAVPGGTIAREGLRTGPPRENGGNLDIKQTGIGTRLFFPVLVDGALFSAGDAHFAQGDGEVCGEGIEIRSTLVARFTVHKGRAAQEHLNHVSFIYQEPERSAGHDGPRRYMVTTGIPVTEDGINYSENTTLAARRALLDMIAYLCREGWNRQQAYTLCSVAVDLRISEIVDLPNVMVSAFLPLDIFT